MREVWINHKLVDFTNAQRQHKVTAGCALLEGGEEVEDFPPREEDDLMAGEQMEDVRGEELAEDPCLLHVCKSGGTCYVTRPGEAACKCPSGWSGNFCETGKFAWLLYFLTFHKIQYFGL